MSDKIEITTPEPEAEPELAMPSAAERLRARRVEQMRLAREVAVEKRAAKLREASMARRAPPPMTAERAEPAREPHIPEQEFRRVRQQDRVTGTDLKPHEKKPGWDYQWNVVRILGRPVDRSDIRDFEDNGGWRVVTQRDMPSRANRGDPPDTPVEDKGQILYTRPLSLTLEAKAEDTERAYQQQHDRMMAAASGASAIRGEEGIPKGRRSGVVAVPVQIAIEGVAG